MLLDRKININNSKMQLKNPHKNEDEKKEIKVELVCNPSEENRLLVFQALGILVSKEDIKNYLLEKNHNVSNFKINN
jgi:hypothetical protein